MNKPLSHIRIDAHQHFWNYDKIKDAWITDEMNIIQRSFLPEDLYPLLKENNIEGTVAIQADQSLKETNFLLQLAEKNNWIKGIVGWIDLKNKNIENLLIHFSSHKKLKGFRHILQAEDVGEYLHDTDFLHGISLLNKYHYTYDILIYHHQLNYINTFVHQFPEQPFIIDHLGKPAIKEQSINEWAKIMQQIAGNKNVYCKLSGLTTEANWQNWKKKELFPYIDVVVEHFGTDRIVFGSDWPVCLLASSYEEWINLLEDYFKHFSSDEKEKIFGRNAIKFYNL